MTPGSRILVALTAVLAFLPFESVPAALAGPAVPLTNCGQTVTGAVYLTADLDCTGQSGHGVFFDGVRGRLELRGFTLSNAEMDGVECSGRCDIVGPGAIVGSGGQGVRAMPRRTTIDDVTISGSRYDGVASQNLVLRNSRVIDNGGSGIVFGVRALLLQSEVSGNQWDGIEGPFYGGYAGREDRCFGTKEARLLDSAVTGNRLSAECGSSRDCADLRSCRQPRLDVTSVCETSLVEPAGVVDANWGVCSAD
jgi:hypothetical protein